MDPQQQFCLKWNSYTSNLAHTFSSYFKSESLADVTLFCGGELHLHINVDTNTLKISSAKQLIWLNTYTPKRKKSTWRGIMIEGGVTVEFE